MDTNQNIFSMEKTSRGWQAFPGVSQDILKEFADFDHKRGPKLVQFGKVEKAYLATVTPLNPQRREFKVWRNCFETRENYFLLPPGWKSKTHGVGRIRVEGRELISVPKGENPIVVISGEGLQEITISGDGMVSFSNLKGFYEIPKDWKIQGRSLYSVSTEGGKRYFSNQRGNVITAQIGNEYFQVTFYSNGTYTKVLVDERIIKVLLEM